MSFLRLSDAQGAKLMTPDHAKQSATKLFAARTSVEQVEEGVAFAPKFDADGLIPCITTDAETGDVLMFGYMNQFALERTITTREAHYWSRSRGCLWHKGATSGLIQKVIEMRVDDDQDAIWLHVQVGGVGASCHVGYRSCFYRSVTLGQTKEAGSQLRFEEPSKLFKPSEVYGNAPNPTRL